MQDRTATNTNLVVFNREGIKRRMTELIPLYAKAGFKDLDLNFCEMMNPQSILNTDLAGEYVAKLIQLKKEYGLTYMQAHAPYPRAGQEPKEMEEKILKAISYAKEAGVPHIVVHPIKGGIEENKRYYSNLLEKSQEIILAIENMESHEEIHSMRDIRAICSICPSRLKALLDTGHANIMDLDIAKEIMDAEGILVGTHINDNDGRSDQHLLPFMGDIAWEKVVHALRDTGYDGFMTYEAMYYSRALSIKDTDMVMQKAFETGIRLQSL